MKRNVFSTKNKTLIGKIFSYVILGIFAVYTIFPLMFLFINSFKSQAEIGNSPLSLPSHWDFTYIENAFSQINFSKSILITAFVTIVSVALIVVVSSLAAWMLVRNKSKVSSFLLMIFISAMLIPFQSVMYPLIDMADKFNMKNLFGLIIMYGGFGLSLSVFMYHGFIKSIPKSIEEAAIIDGANIFQIFFHVVFPLLKSTTVTVVILNAMWIWNDYLLPFQVLGNSELKTLTLELYFAKMQTSQFGNPWELIFPAVLISIIPIIVVFLFLQKHIVKGVADGALKS